jgi:hypothetical protein
MESSVISRHWPASCDRIRPDAGDAAEGMLRGVIRELRDLRTQLNLGSAVDVKVVSAIEALCEAEETQRVLKS